jgi:hypothetical protein
VIASVSRKLGPIGAAFSQRIGTTALIAALALGSADLRGQTRGLPHELSDTEFWRLFTTMSERGGSFASENPVSNESGYQLAIPTLQRVTRPGGVYLGVGPEQNFSYIANLRPALAFIVDIRRQNAMVHLMYKALFEMSPTRADFVAHLFARPLVRDLAPGVDAATLFAAAMLAPPSDHEFAATRDSIVSILVKKHRFDLPRADVETVRRMYEVFRDGGPLINYSSTPRRATGAARYATYAVLMAGTTAPGGVNMSFLSSEERYRRVRDMHLRNLIVPLVGDFGGPITLRAVGAYVRDRGGVVQAFYVSNVEEYLFSPPTYAANFYTSVATFPLDSTSMFIRSVQGGTSGVSRATFDVRLVDSAGVRVRQVIRDSAGRRAIIRSTIDPGLGSSAPGATPPAAAPGYGATLVAGIARIGETVAEFRSGKLRTYRDVVRTTIAGGWR